MPDEQWTTVHEADARIQALLAAGYAIWSAEIGSEVCKIVSAALAHPIAGPAAASLKMGSSQLMSMYILSTVALLDDRLLTVGNRRIIVASLPFVQLERFPKFLQTITQEGKLNGVEHSEEIAHAAADFTLLLRHHAAARMRGTGSGPGGAM